MINFRKITEDNFKEVISMKRPDTEKYVAANAVSLAQAWLYKDDNDVYPFAIYNDDTMVGFMLLEDDVKERSISLWRILIPEEHTNKGYGTEAIKKIIELSKESKKYDIMYIDYVIGNERARHVYEKIGFKATGEISNGEVVMSLQLKD